MTKEEDKGSELVLPDCYNTGLMAMICIAIELVSVFWSKEEKKRKQVKECRVQLISLLSETMM